MLTKHGRPTCSFFSSPRLLQMNGDMQAGSIEAGRQRRYASRQYKQIAATRGADTAPSMIRPNSKDLALLASLNSWTRVKEMGNEGGGDDGGEGGRCGMSEGTRGGYRGGGGDGAWGLGVGGLVVGGVVGLEIGLALNFAGLEDVGGEWG